MMNQLYFPPYQTPYGPGVYQQAVQQAPQQPQQPADDRIWVQGESAANAYLVAANGFVRLWDSTAQVFYEKQADQTGRPFPLVAYEYKRIGGEPEVKAGEFVTSAEYEKLLERVSALENRKCSCKEGEADA